MVDGDLDPLVSNSEFPGVPRLRLESLIRLIEAADYMSFRQIALRALVARGFRVADLADGWKDGGSDVRVYQTPPNPLRFGIQVSVERDWRTKLRGDARKVRDILGLGDLLLVSSRRIAEAEFQTVADAILRDMSVRVQRMDSQAIASAALAGGFAQEILEILGIDVGVPEADNAKSDARQDVAYAFSFFGTEASEFRSAVIEQAIISTLFHASGAIARRQTLASTTDLLGLSDNQEQTVAGVLDRMLQRGDIHQGDDGLLLRPDIANAHKVMVAVREQDWKALRGEVVEVLKAFRDGTTPQTAAIDAIVGALGALILVAGGATASALSTANPHAGLQQRLQAQLRSLQATLDACGLPEGAERDRLINTLVHTASASAIGRHLIAGELFASLAGMQTPQLVRALGATANVVVILDSSVSIPILTSVLYAPSARHYSVAARHAFDQLRAHGFKIVLPVDYLEETATHLIEAYRSYRTIILDDPDLRESENAFVADFTQLRVEGKISIGFVEFLSGFGLNEALAKGDFYVARDVFTKRLETLLHRYGIEVRRLGSPSRASFVRAETAIGLAEYERNIRRPAIIIKHDLRTIAYLMDQEGSAIETYVLCTWDGLHFYVRDIESKYDPRWQVIDPAFLGDLLSLAGADAGRAAVLAPAVVAMMSSDKAAQQGAYVWDVLAQLEKGNLHDAQLIGQAKDFKASFIRTSKADVRFQDVKAAWLRWKQQHQEELFPDENRQPKA